jgi:hypothetical protein
MRFELEPDNRNQPDEALRADLQRVASLVEPARITKEPKEDGTLPGAG